MGDDKAVLREVHWRQIFPWLAIFRSFGVALDLKKMALGAMGLLTMAVGWWLLAALFELTSRDDAAVRSMAREFKYWPWAHERSITFGMTRVVPADTARPWQSPETFQTVDRVLHSPLHTLWQLGTNWRLVLRPVYELVRPFQEIFSRGSTAASALFALVCGLWAAVVWAFFGGAITRIAAVQFAREEKISLRESMRFAASKYLSYGGAPIIPLGFVFILWLFCMLGGLVTWTPYFGDLFAGILWFLPLLAGFVMALILVGWAVGWPLMFATISVEGSDSFDALSRSFAYAFQRPWHYLFYVLLAAVFGSICAFFVLLFADLLVYLSRWAVEWGGTESLRAKLDQLFYYAPPATDWGPAPAVDAGLAPAITTPGGTTGLPVTTQGIEPAGVTRVAAYLITVWLYLLFFMVVGYIYSFFWSAATVIYYLLRRDVDNTEMQEVYLEGEEDDEGLPLEPAPASPVVTTPQPAPPGAG